MNAKHVADVVKEALPAGAGVAVTGGIGSAILGAGTWLVPVLQVAVSIIFIVMAIDKRMARLHKAVNETRGEIETLEGRVNALQCVRTVRPRCEDTDEDET